MRTSTTSDSKCSKFSKGTWIAIILGGVVAVTGLVLLICWGARVFDKASSESGEDVTKYCMLKNEASWKADEHKDALIFKGGDSPAVQDTQFKIGEKISFKCLGKTEGFHQKAPTEYTCLDNGSFKFEKLLPCAQDIKPTISDLTVDTWEATCQITKDDFQVRLEAKDNTVKIPDVMNGLEPLFTDKSVVGYGFTKDDAKVVNQEYRCVAEDDKGRVYMSDYETAEFKWSNDYPTITVNNRQKQIDCNIVNQKTDYVLKLVALDNSLTIPTEEAGSNAEDKHWIFTDEKYNDKKYKCVYEHKTDQSQKKYESYVKEAKFNFPKKCKLETQPGWTSNGDLVLKKNNGEFTDQKTEFDVSDTLKLECKAGKKFYIKTKTIGALDEYEYVCGADGKFTDFKQPLSCQSPNDVNKQMPIVPELKYADKKIICKNKDKTTTLKLIPTAEIIMKFTKTTTSDSTYENIVEYTFADTDAVKVDDLKDKDVECIAETDERRYISDPKTIAPWTNV